MSKSAKLHLLTISAITVITGHTGQAQNTHSITFLQKEWTLSIYRKCCNFCNYRNFFYGFFNRRTTGEKKMSSWLDTFRYAPGVFFE